MLSTVSAPALRPGVLEHSDELLITGERPASAWPSRTRRKSPISAMDNRELAKLDAKRLSAVLGRYSILSPVNGVVTDRLQSAGELAQSGDAATAILKIAQIDPLRVDVVLPVARYGGLKPGAVVDVKPEPPFTGTYKATVRIVDKVIDSASGTFRVRLELPNPRGDVPAGVKCTAAL